MNIEESKSLLGWVSLNKLYIDTHNECDYHNIHSAIETLLTAYEKEKEAIEKLKEKNEFLNWYFENQKDNFVHKDKIKAKMEEYEEKIKKIKEKDVWEEPYDTEKYVRYTNYISVLQLLLKEE